MFSDLFQRVFRLGDLEWLGARLTRLFGGGGGGRSLNLRGGNSGAGGGSAPIDGHLTGLRRVDVKRDKAQPLGTSGGAAEHLLEEVVAGGVTGNTAVDDTAEEGRTTETVGTVDTAGKLTASVETIEGLALVVENLGLVVDLNTTHCEVDDGLHEGDVEVVVDVEGSVVEVLLAPGVLDLAIGDGVVGGEGLLEVLGSAANLLGELLAGDLLHETTARVVAGVEVKDVGSLGVEDKSDGELVLVLLLPHHAGDVVTVAELIAESVTVTVEEETTLTTEGLSSQELGLGVGVLGVNETSRVDLDLVQVDAVTADGHNHLLAVTGGMGAVGGGEAEGVGAVLLEETILGEVGGITTGGENNGAVEDMALAVVLVGNTSYNIALLVERGNAGLEDDLDALRLGLGELLKSLHEGVRDGHTGELGVVATVCSGLRMTSTLSNFISTVCRRGGN